MTKPDVEGDGQTQSAALNGSRTPDAARIRELEQEVLELRRQLEERKLVERAKGAVMRALRIEEDDAHYRMRKYASDHNLKLADLATRIVEADEVFRQLRMTGDTRR
jgi:hypothetical protein